MELTWNIRWRRLQWVGHVMSMKDERLLKKARQVYTKGEHQLEGLEEDG
jgi:hypothetical protein